LGDILVTAGNNIFLTTGEKNQTVDESHQHKGSPSAFFTTTTTTRDTLDSTTLKTLIHLKIPIK
jgi:hypothetical protein